MEVEITSTVTKCDICLESETPEKAAKSTSECFICDKDICHQHKANVHIEMFDSGDGANLRRDLKCCPEHNFDFDVLFAWVMKKITEPPKLEVVKFGVAQTGGTFDHFHAGHRELLRAGFDAAEFLIIGVVTDKNPDLKKKKYRRHIQKYKERVAVLKSWLDHNHPDRYEIIPLDDTYSREVVLSKTVEAAVICDKTMGHFETINEMRSVNKLKPFALIMSPSEKAAISSSEIRKAIYSS